MVLSISQDLAAKTWHSQSLTKGLCTQVKGNQQEKMNTTEPATIGNAPYI